MRRHVMMTLLDTEQSYVESLRSLIQVTCTVPKKECVTFKHRLAQSSAVASRQVKLEFGSDSRLSSVRQGAMRARRLTRCAQFHYVTFHYKHADGCTRAPTHARTHAHAGGKTNTLSGIRSFQM